VRLDWDGLTLRNKKVREIKNSSRKQQEEELKIKYPFLEPNPFPDCMSYDVYDSSGDEDLYDSRFLNNCSEENFDDSSSICLNTIFGYIGNDEPNTEPCMPSIAMPFVLLMRCRTARCHKENYWPRKNIITTPSQWWPM
jgi:hypothetical protein